MNDYIWGVEKGNKEGKCKKVAEFIETKNGEMVSTCLATGALIRQESGLSAGVFKKGFNQT
jgi:hypothetical protein